MVWFLLLFWFFNTFPFPWVTPGPVCLRYLHFLMIPDFHFCRSQVRQKLGGLSPSWCKIPAVLGNRCFPWANKSPLQNASIDSRYIGPAGPEPVDLHVHMTVVHQQKVWWPQLLKPAGYLFTEGLVRLVATYLVSSLKRLQSWLHIDVPQESDRKQQRQKRFWCANMGRPFASERSSA